MKLLKDLLFGDDVPAATEPLIPTLHGVLDTDRTDAIILAAVKLALAFEDAASDGLSLADALPLARPVQALAASAIHWREASAELKDYTEAEVARLEAKVAELLPDLDSARIRGLVAKALPILPPLVGLIREAAGANVEIEVAEVAAEAAEKAAEAAEKAADEKEEA